MIIILQDDERRVEINMEGGQLAQMSEYREPPKYRELPMGRRFPHGTISLEFKIADIESYTQRVIEPTEGNSLPVGGAQ